jgi:hypothetical protein
MAHQQNQNPTKPMSRPHRKPTQSLSLGKGNAKLDTDTLTFSLPAGFTCPGAEACQAWSHPRTGNLRDGPHQKFRCFAASAEAAWPSVRANRWNNLQKVKTLLKKGKKHLALALCAQIPATTHKVRIHVGGDFFSQAYFDAWMITASLRPQTIFYAYTKSIRLWAKRLRQIPTNMRLTASLGGTQDALAHALRLPTARVVFHPKEADQHGLETDHDDSLASAPIRDAFALLLHGPQPKGSQARQATQTMRKETITFGYSKKAKAA